MNRGGGFSAYGGPGDAEAANDEEEREPDAVEGGAGAVFEDGEGGGGGVDVANGLKADGIGGEGGLGAFVVGGGAVDALDAGAGVLLSVELVEVTDVDAMSDVGVGRGAFAADGAGGDGAGGFSPGAGFVGAGVGAPEDPGKGQAGESEEETHCGEPPAARLAGWRA